MPGNTELGHLVALDPAEARQRIASAYRESGAHLANAATLLGVAYVSLWRYVQSLDMRPELDRLSRKAHRDGWHHESLGGRPRKQRGNAPRRNSKVK